LKEPHYFSKDFATYSDFTRSDYYGLFESAKSQHVYRGESSVYYLYSTRAISNIVQEHPDARMVVMLRNPVQLVHSLHAQHLVGLTEDLSSFEDAWHAQSDRAIGRRIPASCAEPSLLQYQRIGSLGYQLQRALSRVAREHVHVIFFDDFQADTPRVFNQVLAFLGLEQTAEVRFERVNANTVLRSRMLRHLLNHRRLPAWFRRWGRRVGLQRIHRQMLQWNQVAAKRDQLSPDMTAELVDAFRDDVALLSELTHRDLGHWLKV
jgi:hypothetical protein